MKQIKSFMVMEINGANRITVTFDEINESGMPVKKNNKIPFYATDQELIGHINAAREIIRKKVDEN